MGEGREKEAGGCGGEAWILGAGAGEAGRAHPQRLCEDS